MKNQEHQEQVKLIQYLTLLEKQKKIVTFYAVINENSVKNPRYGAKLKAQGKRAGVSDVVVLLKDCTLYIEMKRPRKKLKSGKLSNENLASKEQLDFIGKLENTTYAYGKVCYGFLEANKYIDTFL